MKMRFTFLLALSLSLLDIALPAQEPFQNRFGQNDFVGSHIPSVFQDRETGAYSQIKGIRVFGKSSGIAFTAHDLFRTDDNGDTWRDVPFPKTLSERICDVDFIDINTGWVILADRERLRLTMARTDDGGARWVISPIDVSPNDLAESDLYNISLNLSNSPKIYMALRLSSSSNFERTVNYLTEDDGASWTRLRSEATGRSDVDIYYQDRFDTMKEFYDSYEGGRIRKTGVFPSDPIVLSNRLSHYPGPERLPHSLWFVTQTGNCEGFKTHCTQTSKLYRDNVEIFAGVTVLSVTEITPPRIKELSQTEGERAGADAATSWMFTHPPGGSTRISLNRGFDKCTAAPAAQMQTWWNNSPLYDSNIYISGRNRGCSQPQLTAAWVTQVSAMGWGLIPTIVGYQSPCSVCTTCQKHSTDPATAETQGRGEADIAIADATGLGLTTGSVLYYDMERYDDVTGGTCSTAVKSFLKGWTDRVKELGYKSGVYGSPTNAVGDWLSIPLASRMDAIWMARWDNNPSVWSYAPPSPAIPTDAWADHQRIKQWQAPHNETWGGVTFNIDGNNADGPVAGVVIAKNKNADFDGDGRSDISVFRPDTGIWYISNSATPTFSALQFGLSSDRLTPGDYDGDGKTDYAVFRPPDGTWHLLTKAGFYNTRQFGAGEDIPAAADFNGDGKTDVAVFRPSTGTWFISNSDSLGTFAYVPFGSAGDKPVPGDYDGDGKADIAVYRPSSGVWYVMQSSNGSVSTVGFGLAADLPAQGDYDGDGKHDFAVYRDGTWYLLQTATGFTAFQFGLSGDLPVTGDFDGDGRADAAVFRPSNGVWYVLASQSGFYSASFGLSGDRPIENAYLPQ